MEAMKEPQVRDFRRLVVYQKAMKLTVETKTIVRTFPYEEKDALGKQLWRAVTSICGNISEGNTQLYVSRELSFLAISLGSAGEVQTWLEIACKVGYINQATFQRLDNEVVEIRKMLVAMIKRLRQEISEKKSA